MLHNEVAGVALTHAIIHPGSSTLAPPNKPCLV